VPQIVSIGCYDLVDLVGWHPVPAHLNGLPGHAHNRLLSSVVLDADARRKVARAIMGKLAEAKGEVVFILPLQGGNEWDRDGGPLCDAEGLAAFVAEVRAACPGNVQLVDLDAHINDPAFSEAALAVVDGWIATGILPKP
jgi:uncharacterized protein (UPF0261 family)